MDWMKVESKKHPGKYYYFNRKTQESSWQPPPGYVSSKGESSKVKLPSQSSTKAHRVSNKGSLHLQTNANNRMEHVTAVSVQPMEEAMETERWANEEEIGMDVDMTEEEELALITEIHSTRNHLPLASSVECLGEQAHGPLVYTEKLYLVLDTNILLSHLDFLAELKDYAIKSVGRPVLVLPWVVMQELDALKTRSNQRVAKKARQAIRFLHGCFEAHHPRVRGQTMDEVQTEVTNLAIANNDDRILHCCLLYQEKVKGHGGRAVLFSNDVQLCSKAIVNNVRALNRKTLLNELRALCKNAPSADATSYTQTNEFASRVAHKMSSSAAAPVTVKVDRAVLDDLLCESESLVRDALTAVITKEMNEAYGADLWEKIVAVKPPWTLKDVVFIIDKHWVAVFRDVIANYHQHTNVPKLFRHTTHRPMAPTANDIQSFQFHAMELLRAFRQVSEYNGSLPYSIAGLAVLSDKLTEAKGNSPAVRQVTAPTVSLPLITSLLSPSCNDIVGLCGVEPNHPLDQLRWVLDIVMAITKHCHSRVTLSLLNNRGSASDRQEAAVFLSQLLEILNGTVRAITNLLVAGSGLPQLREMLMAFQVFLQTTLQLNSPLSIEGLLSCIQSAKVKVQELLQAALVNYNAILNALQLLPRELGL